jgi:hypothetical protein
MGGSSRWARCQRFQFTFQALQADSTPEVKQAEVVTHGWNRMCQTLSLRVTRCPPLGVPHGEGWLYHCASHHLHSATNKGRVCLSKTL